MGVYLNGNIKASGYLTLPVGSSLNDAIALGGGKNFKTGTIELIRMNNNQKVEKRTFRFDLNWANSEALSSWVLMSVMLFWV